MPMPMPKAVNYTVGHNWRTP